MTDQPRSPHIEYRVVGEKAYEVDRPHGGDCFDILEGTVHSKPDAEKLAQALQGLGYKVKMVRVSKSYLIDEKFSGEEESEQESEGTHP
jgi:hypothetical protein